LALRGRNSLLRIDQKFTYFLVTVTRTFLQPDIMLPLWIGFIFISWRQRWELLHHCWFIFSIVANSWKTQVFLSNYFGHKVAFGAKSMPPNSTMWSLLLINRKFVSLSFWELPRETFIFKQKIWNLKERLSSL